MAPKTCSKLRSFKGKVKIQGHEFTHKIKDIAHNVKNKLRDGMKKTVQKTADCTIPDFLVCSDGKGKLRKKPPAPRDWMAPQTNEVDRHPEPDPVESQDHILAAPSLARVSDTAPNAIDPMQSAREHFQNRGHFDFKYWGPTSNISYEALKSLALNVLDPNGELGGLGVELDCKKQGAYHTAYILKAANGSKIVIKVPATGHMARWSKTDACNLRTEALTMRYIRMKTNGKFPVPDVYRYSTVLENEIGAPYIVMEAMEGVPATDVWHPEGDVEVNTIQIRHDLLKSLAEAMAGLQDLVFDKAGMLDFENDDLEAPFIGPVRAWCNDSQNNLGDPVFARHTRNIPAASTSREYFSALTKIWEGEDHSSVQDVGVLRIAQAALDCYPFRQSLQSPTDETETFVLQHPDLGLQNILCDPETYKVTAIIDWDLVKTVPRCVGFASVPLWLREDWQPQYLYPFRSGLAVEMLELYRNHYSDCLSDAMGGQGDCKYTKKSPIYTALDTAIFGNGVLEDFTTKVLQSAFPRQSASDMTWYLGNEEDGGEGAEAVEERLSILLDTKHRDLFDDDSDDSDTESDDESSSQAAETDSDTTISVGPELGKCDSADLIKLSLGALSPVAFDGKGEFYDGVWKEPQLPCFKHFTLAECEAP
ncbi:hypothetical protein BU16DRAFT_540797 [Lophium mytilinum]|uniref:Aminoglycoside phosphotransferase domain-containing protein n=1 Tax=Lophium mytilinum TaxID=390894 RepID=A0A6A6QQA0_9PEZI|nr:hypothetical protein BU16DRAFT_540797 [Lophium mytilinum]